MNTYGVDLMGRRRRRRHTAEFKAAVIFSRAMARPRQCPARCSRLRLIWERS